MDSKRIFREISVFLLFIFESILVIVLIVDEMTSRLFFALLSFIEIIILYIIKFNWCFISAFISYYEI